MNSQAKKKTKNLSLADWTKLAELIEKVEAMHPINRQAFIDRLKATRPHRARQLERALMQRTEMDGFLDKGPGDNFRKEVERDIPLPELGVLSSVTQVDKYRLLERIKTGGMAEIYRAELFGAKGFSKTVAIKKILPSLVRDKEMQQLLEQEARLCSVLNHSNIVHIFDYFSNSEGHFLVMEYIHGRNLKEMFDILKMRGERMPMDLGLYILQEICKALEFAHNKKNEAGEPLHIIHRDVSPQNIMISFEGSVKLVDFGIAKALGTIKTASGVRKGKFAYMSPEQANGKDPDQRTDLYSLGLVLYEMVAGRSALGGGSNELEIFRSAQVGAVPPIATVNRATPVAMQKIIAKALQINPNERYLSAFEFGHALSQYSAQNSFLIMEKEIVHFMDRIFIR